MRMNDAVLLRKFVDSSIALISSAEKNLNSKVEKRVKDSVKLLDAVLPKIREITSLYLKGLCNSKSVASNNAFIIFLRVDVLEKIREHTILELPKKYAKILKTTIK